MDAKGLFQINPKKLRKSGVKGLGKIKLTHGRKGKSGLKHHKVKELFR